jgi:hypothetical protein
LPSRLNILDASGIVVLLVARWLGQALAVRD